MRGCVHGSLYFNEIRLEGGAAIAGALRHVPSLTQLKYVVGEGASAEAAGCVGRGCDGGRAGRQVCFWWADVEWVRVFGRYNAGQWEARGMFGMREWQGAKDVLGMGKEV